MMRISEHGNAIVMLAAAALFAQAQSDTFPAKSQNHSSVLDVRQIVESSIAATQRHWQTRLQYTYVERDEDRRLDSEGRVKSEEVDVSRTILVNGVPFGNSWNAAGSLPRPRRNGNRKRSSTS